MSHFKYSNKEVEAEIEELAKKVLAPNNPYILLRQKLGRVYENEDYQEAYSYQGQGALPAWQMSLLMIVQHKEGLTDREIAEQVGSRIDLKYLLGLPLTAPGFHYTAMGRFRERLIEGSLEMKILDKQLEKVREIGLLKERGKQRTDATQVLAAMRQLTRLEVVGETMRRALNELATVEPQWVRETVGDDWYERYEFRFENHRLPRKKGEREELQKQVGADGLHLLDVIGQSDSYGWLSNLRSVKILREVWTQQYRIENGVAYWRTREELPPSSELIQSPYETEARNRTKRKTNWNGYMAHLTETCDPQQPHLIVHTETTPATTHDNHVLPIIHEALQAKELLPKEHLVDASYIDAEQVLLSKKNFQVDLVGPVPPNTSWQALDPNGFDVTSFQINWEAQQAICPEQHLNRVWRIGKDRKKREYHIVEFNQKDCVPCSQRSRCVKGDTSARRLHLRPKDEFEYLQQQRLSQNSDQFKSRYNKRAGVEGAISQAVRAFGFRQSRYVGLAKTRLQHIATAAAINLTRLTAWWSNGKTGYTPRKSAFAQLRPVFT